METTLEVRRKDTPAFVKQPVLNFGAAKKAAAELIIEDFEEEALEIVEEDKVNQQYKHVSGEPSNTMSKQKTNRGAAQKLKDRQRKPTPATSETNKVIKRNKEAFESVPESLEEEEQEQDSEEAKEKTFWEIKLPKNNSRKATPAHVTSHTFGITGSLRHLNSNSIEEEEEDEDDEALDIQNTCKDFGSSQETKSFQGKSRKATPAVVSSRNHGMAEQFQQFSSKSIEEEVTDEGKESSNKNSTFSTSQEAIKLKGKGRKATPAFVTSCTCVRQKGKLRQVQGDSINEETEDDTEPNVELPRNGVNTSQENQLLQNTKPRKATPAFVDNYACGMAGKLRQFQGNSIEEEIEEQEADGVMPCLAIRDNSCLETKHSQFPRRKISSVTAPPIEEIVLQ